MLAMLYRWSRMMGSSPQAHTRQMPEQIIDARRCERRRFLNKRSRQHLESPRQERLGEHELNRRRFARVEDVVGTDVQTHELLLFWHLPARVFQFHAAGYYGNEAQWALDRPVAGIRDAECLALARLRGLSSFTCTRVVTSADPLAGNGAGNAVRLTAAVLFVRSGSAPSVAVAVNGPGAFGVTVSVIVAFADFARSGTARLTTLPLTEKPTEALTTVVLAGRLTPSTTALEVFGPLFVTTMLRESGEPARIVPVGPLALTAVSGFWNSKAPMSVWAPDTRGRPRSSVVGAPASWPRSRTPLLPLLGRFA